MVRKYELISNSAQQRDWKPENVGGEKVVKPNVGFIINTGRKVQSELIELIHRLHSMGLGHEVAY